MAPRRPSPAMFVAVLALFVALGGGAYAALSKNTVGSKQLRPGAVKARDLARNAVDTTKVRDGSLLKSDFAPGQLLQGPEGAQGATGPEGPRGATGPQGPSGVVATRSFDQTAWGSTVSANATMPMKCRTDPYTAGEGEIAVVQVSGTAAPQNAVLDYLFVGVGRIANAGAPTLVTARNVEGMNDGSASASSEATVQLTPGTSYVFGPMFNSNSAGGVSLGSSTCQATVMIVRN